MASATAGPATMAAVTSLHDCRCLFWHVGGVGGAHWLGCNE